MFEATHEEQLRSDGQRFLLNIDQFEELFTRRKDDGKSKRFPGPLLGFVAVEWGNGHPKKYW
jgi:hypothetical protein